MNSTGNENILKQNSTTIEGAQIRVGSENPNTPSALFMLVGVCCFLQVTVLLCLAHCLSCLTIDRLENQIRNDARVEKTATRAALEAIDRVSRGEVNIEYTPIGEKR